MQIPQSGWKGTDRKGTSLYVSFEMEMCRKYAVSIFE